MRSLLLLALVLLSSGCASGNKTSTGRTERERDSVIANSKVPGAPAVKKSMAAADSAAARVQAQDSIARSEGE